MGVFSGSISFTRFYVRGAVPKRFQGPFMKAIRLRAFEPLDPDDVEDERWGWCAPDNLLDLELTQQKVIFNQYLALGVRRDKWRIPRALLRAELETASEQQRERTGKEKLSKREKEELVFRVTRRLRKRVLPSMRQFDMCWDIDRAELRLWNRSVRAKEEFALLFERTFSLTLDEASPYVVAKQLLGQQELATVETLDPSSFLDR